MSRPEPRNAETQIIILAGGQGTRLRSVNATRPKPMVLVGDKPFLHWLIDYYYGLGYRKFLLLTCHMAEQIEEYPWTDFFQEGKFEFEREPVPYGTGGAVRAAFESRGLKAAWVLNGDTLLIQELPRLDPQDPGLEALYLTVEKSKAFDATPNLATQGSRVVGELAPGQSGGQFIDAGAIFVTRRAIDRYREAPPFSLNKLLTPAMHAGKVGFVIARDTYYDIGTPERLERFQAFLKARPAGGH